MFNIETLEVKDVVVLKLNGVLREEPEAQQIIKVVTEKIGEGRRKFLVNCESLRFMNSIGAGAIVSVLSRVGKASGQMKFCGLQERIRRVFMIISAHHLFDIKQNCDEALEELLDAE